MQISFFALFGKSDLRRHCCRRHRRRRRYRRRHRRHVVVVAVVAVVIIVDVVDVAVERLKLSKTKKIDFLSRMFSSLPPPLQCISDFSEQKHFLSPSK